MIDPKFKDMLTLANMGVTPDIIADFRNHRKKIQQGEDALKMRNVFYLATLLQILVRKLMLLLCRNKKEVCMIHKIKEEN